MGTTNGMVDEGGEVQATKDHPLAKPTAALILIAGSLVLGGFLIWIVTVGWVLELIAGAVLLANFALGIFAGWWIYKFLNKAMYQWVRVTVAVILGFSIAMVVAELTHSHKLIRYYDHYSNDGDDDH